MTRFQPSIVSTLAIALLSFGKYAEAAPLFNVDGWENGNVKWHNPPSGFQNLCGKVTTVFGVAVCVTSEAWNMSPTKCDHIAHVFYQLLDNNADGVVDDPALVNEMVNEKYLLLVPSTEREMETFNYDNLPNGVNSIQQTGVFEAFPNSCDSPQNRGASPTDRSTWAQHIDVSNKNCDPNRDATTEEILHLMTYAALQLYPSLWYDDWNSAVGSAIKDTNGNCGWGYLFNWIDPSSDNCEGQYAYNDRTCGKGCIVIEGIYWAIVSYIGGLYTVDRADSVSNEWLMTTPDDSMIVLPTNVNNARSLQSGSPELYALVSDTSSNGHKWIPSIMPDGIYKGLPTGSFPSPTTPAFGFCFSALNKVEVQGKGLVPISNLEIGDMIRAGNDAFSPVLGFGKRQHDKIAQYLQLFSEGLEDTPLELTHDHMVFVSGKFVAASEVRVGDLLGTHRVVAIKEVLRRGAYAPVTESGDLVVGGVLASCYTSMLDYSLFDRHAAFHAFMAPFRAGWISRWSYDEDRAVWIRQWCPRLSSLKYVLSPLMQYLVSSVVVLIYVVSGVVWLAEGRGQMLLWFLLSLGIAGYRLKGCGRSKVKGL